MGIITDSIFTLYKKALEEGNMDQATHAVDLMKLLKNKVDIHGFVDHELEEKVSILGIAYEPFPYRYYESERMIVFGNSAILLTQSENRFFKLLSQNETEGTEIKPITHEMIANHMWENKSVTSNALRITIKRMRNKIEPIPERPKLLINFYKKGYLFLGKQLKT